jgi:hypothetical protein
VRFEREAKWMLLVPALITVLAIVMAVLGPRILRW